jgi:hypothetical protein
MKVLTLRQPWASLFVSGCKQIETRSWQTSYRGPLAIHASAKMTIDEMHLCLTLPFAEALGALGFHTPGGLPRAAILGTVTLVDCLPMVAGRATGDAPEFAFNDPRALTDRERAFGHYAAGRFAWITSLHRLILDKPIPAKGRLGLWELPAEIAARLA